MPPSPSTRTATAERTNNGIVLLRIRPNVRQQVRDAEENIILGVSMAQGHRRPLLVDLRDAEPLPPEVRHYYAGRTLAENFSALGLLVPVGAFGRMFGNLYLRISKPGIPAQLFVDEEAAREWAGQFLT